MEPREQEAVSKLVTGQDQIPVLVVQSTGETWLSVAESVAPLEGHFRRGSLPRAGRAYNAESRYVDLPRSDIYRSSRATSLSASGT